MDDYHYYSCLLKVAAILLTRKLLLLLGILLLDLKYGSLSSYNWTAIRIWSGYLLGNYGPLSDYT